MSTRVAASNLASQTTHPLAISASRGRVCGLGLLRLVRVMSAEYGRAIAAARRYQDLKQAPAPSKGDNLTQRVFDEFYRS